MADVLESISVNPTHTPALYSTFLRALISARLEGPSDEKANADVPNGMGAGHQVHFQEMGTMYPLNEFQFDGEMGPVADVSTFPPTMAPNPMEDPGPGVTMDSIFSSNFWDSVLVPGKTDISMFLQAFFPLTSLSGYNSLDGLTGGFVFGGRLVFVIR